MRNFQPDQVVSKRYVLIEPIGKGAMGSVWKAWDNNLGRNVAIKFILDEKTDDLKMQSRFKNEKDNLVRVGGHPNVVPIYDFDITKDKTPFIVMQFIEGQTLEKRINAHGLDVDEIERLLEQVCKALSLIHRQKLVHRDLKPSNILLKDDGKDNWDQALIGDFGVARLLEDPLADGGGTGTPGYRAPEQLEKNLDQIDHRADIYALGVITWQLFSGLPIPDLKADPIQRLPDELLKIIQKATAHHPSDRFDSADEFYNEMLNAPWPPVEPPYKGLVTYNDEDADLFFGRKKLVANILEQLEKSPLLVIEGPSGCGKSSIVQAGIIPALRGGLEIDRKVVYKPISDWVIVSFTPTSAPIYDLAIKVMDGDIERANKLVVEMGKNENALCEFFQNALNESQKLLIVIDQFEQLFTLCSDEWIRRSFIDNILSLALESQGENKVLVTVRDDFYHLYNRVERLRREIEGRKIFLGPMTVHELQDVILGPGKLKTWQLNFESNLVAVILQDIKEQPGALPFLSQALLRTWEERRGRTLTLEGYKEGGQVRGAIAKTAEEIYEGLTPNEKELTRRIFIRLINFGNGSADTRQQLGLDELRSTREQPRLLENTLSKLAQGRLITLSSDKNQEILKVDIAHEALILGWPRFQDWLGEYREKEQTRRRLQIQVTEWKRIGRLLGMIEIEEAKVWLESTDSLLLGFSQDLIDLYEQSRALLDGEEKEKEHQRQRELDQTIKLANSEKKRSQTFRNAFGITIILLFVAACLAILAGGSAIFARIQQQTAQQSANELATEVVVRGTAEANAIKNEEIAVTQESIAIAERNMAATSQAEAEYQQNQVHEQWKIAISRQIGTLGITSENNLDFELLICTQANNFSNTVETKKCLIDNLLNTTRQNFSVDKILNEHSEQITAFAFSPNGKILASGSDDAKIILWNIAEGQIIGTLEGHVKGTKISVVHHPHEDILASGGISSLTFHPDGAMLVSSGLDEQLLLWDLSNREIKGAFAGHSFVVNSLAFSPDGKTLITGGGEIGSFSNEGEIIFWNLDTLLPIEVIPVNKPVVSIAISKDGNTLAYSLDLSGDIFLMTIQERQFLDPLQWEGNNSGILSLAFSSKENVIAAGYASPGQASEGGYIILWNVDTRTPLWNLDDYPSFSTFLANGENVKSLSFNPEGDFFVTNANDVIYWGIENLPTNYTAKAMEIYSLYDSTEVAFNPNGMNFVVGFSDGQIEVIKTENENGIFREVLAITEKEKLSQNFKGICNLALRNDQKTLFVILENLEAKLLDIETGNFSETLWQVPAAYGCYSSKLSREGQIFASANNNSIGVIDTSSGNIIAEIPVQEVGSINLSLEGNLLVFSSHSGTFLMDLKTGKIIETIGNELKLLNLTLSFDNEIIAGRTEENFIALYFRDTKNLQIISAYPATENIPAYENIAISPDNRLVAWGSSNKIILWDIESNSQFGVPLVGHTQNAIAVLRFSPNQEYFMSISNDVNGGEVFLWDTSSFSIIAKLNTGEIDQKIIFGKDSNFVIFSGWWWFSGFGSQYLDILNIDIDYWKSIACSISGRNLTRSEWDQYFSTEPYQKSCPEWPEGY